MKTYDAKLINKVKSNMWIPHDRSDFRRIVPHMILLSDKFSLQKKNIFGEMNADSYEFDKNLVKEWQILRDFISSSRIPLTKLSLSKITPSKPKSFILFKTPALGLFV